MVAATTESIDASFIICHNCGKAGRNRSGCAVPAKAHWKVTSPTHRSQEGWIREGRKQKWCTGHKTTTHSDAKSYVQGAPRSQTGNKHAAGVSRARTLPDDAKNHLVISFDNAFDKGSTSVA